MSTWFIVMLKYIFSGLTLGLTSVQTVVAGKVVPAFSWTWVIAFDYTGAVALLTLCFGLYFGNKFSPGNVAAANGNVTEITTK